MFSKDFLTFIIWMPWVKWSWTLDISVDGDTVKKNWLCFEFERRKRNDTESDL